MPDLSTFTTKKRRHFLSKAVYFNFPGHPLDGKEFENTVLYNDMVVGETESRVRTSENTLNYRDLIRRNEVLPENRYSFRLNRDSGSYVHGSLTETRFAPYERVVFVNEGATHSVVVPGVSYHGIDASVLANARDRAINKILLKIKDQKINLAQVYAERAQTSKLILDAANRLANALRSLKRGDVESAAKALGLKPTRRQKRKINPRRQVTDDWLSQNWLSLQYGWIPLVNDVYGAMEVLASKPFRKYLNHAVAQVTISESVSSSSQTSEYSESVRQKADVTFKYGVWFTVGDTSLKALANVGITNPALVAWELLPWSFVIDWFVPIGNFISTWDATVGCDFHQGYATTVVVNGQQVTREYLAPSGASGFRGTAKRDQDMVTITRDKLINFPSARLPSFKNPVSAIHAINAMALLQQLKSK